MSSRPSEHDLHICFVCTGNICRSPMAALVFAEHLRREALADRVRVTSSGTGPWHVGEKIDSRAGATLREHGYPTAHTAAQVGEAHLEADLLVALDSGHARDLRRLVDDPARIRLLRSFGPEGGDLDVPDPYYGGRRGFTEVLGMIEAASPGLVAWVKENLPE
ncbi:low molecular weight protein-tyrosine-phosphatase [Allokutzneria oryzae]|uniref:protein-tyrosine-phosphatase n=1 Tax=Allokutzneria oryzae TaxID=1378989 RepID=A0ABV6A7J1_9PSEU